MSDIIVHYRKEQMVLTTLLCVFEKTHNVEYILYMYRIFQGMEAGCTTQHTVYTGLQEGCFGSTEFQ